MSEVMEAPAKIEPRAQHLIDAYLGGTTQAALARREGVTRQAVQDMIARHIDAYTSANATPESWNEPLVRALRHRGWSWKRIALAHGRPETDEHDLKRHMKVWGKRTGELVR